MRSAKKRCASVRFGHWSVMGQRAIDAGEEVNCPVTDQRGMAVSRAHMVILGAF